MEMTASDSLHGCVGEMSMVWRNGSETLKGSVWIDGKISSIETATIPITDRGLLFGHAIFETMLALGGDLVLWEEHLARLRAGALRARLGCPGESTLRHALQECMSHFRNSVDLALSKRFSVRLILTGGDGLSLQPRRDEQGLLSAARIIVICRPATGPSEETRKRGFALKSCPDERSKELVDIKSCSYLWNLMCLDDAIIEGFDDALLVNPDGEISEATTASFVWMTKGEKVLCSAPQENNVLPGTTLLCLQNALAALGHDIRWQALKLGRYEDVLACALVSSVRGLVPVGRIDDFEFDVDAARETFELWNEALLNEQLRSCESLLK
jgi:branched-subunit amino acid aminotransferase/4-amino-4-deoxychorismate lyase